jgi:tetratricopeptide (TPR) repeat protein
LPGWQTFYENYQKENFELLSVAVDIQGSESVLPYVQNTSFKTVVDPENKLANYFGFKIVPNGIFVDENGTIRLIKQGFKIEEEAHYKAVEKLIKNEKDTIELEDNYYKPERELSELERQLSETKFRLGTELSRNAKYEEALKELDEALELDPENFLIRKQRWYIRYPEKFSPAIDINWQQGQLEKEKQEEEKGKNSSVCGHEGCILPGTDKRTDN